MVALQLMKDLIAEKKKLNQRVSLRWVAGRMKVSSGRLSEVLNGKRTLSEAFLQKFCVALRVSADEKYSLLRTFEESSVENKGSFGPILSQQQIESLSDWKPFAVLSFLQTVIYENICNAASSPQGQINVIAQKMKIQVDELNALIETLERAELLRWELDRWVPRHSEATTGIDISNENIKNGHIRRLELATEKLKSIPADQRDFSSVTLTMDPKDLPKAKKMLRSFRRNFSRAMEKGAKRGVFQLNLQLFPLVVDSEIEEVNYPAELKNKRTRK